MSGVSCAGRAKQAGQMDERGRVWQAGQQDKRDERGSVRLAVLFVFFMSVLQTCLA